MCEINKIQRPTFLPGSLSSVGSKNSKLALDFVLFVRHLQVQISLSLSIKQAFFCSFIHFVQEILRVEEKRKMCGGSIISDEPLMKRRGKLTAQEFWAELDTISQLWRFDCSSNDANQNPNKGAHQNPPTVLLFGCSCMYDELRIDVLKSLFMNFLLVKYCYIVIAIAFEENKMATKVVSRKRID